MQVTKWGSAGDVSFKLQASSISSCEVSRKLQATSFKLFSGGDSPKLQQQAGRLKIFFCSDSPKLAASFKIFSVQIPKFAAYETTLNFS
jgi:hypothetical protein